MRTWNEVQRSSASYRTLKKFASTHYTNWYSFFWRIKEIVKVKVQSYIYTFNKQSPSMAVMYNYRVRKSSTPGRLLFMFAPPVTFLGQSTGLCQCQHFTSVMHTQLLATDVQVARWFSHLNIQVHYWNFFYTWLINFTTWISTDQMGVKIRWSNKLISLYNEKELWNIKKTSL